MARPTIAAANSRAASGRGFFLGEVAGGAFGLFWPSSAAGGEIADSDTDFISLGSFWVQNPARASQWFSVIDSGYFFEAETAGPRTGGA